MNCHARDERAREQVRRQHRVNNRQRQRQEQVLGDARQRDDGREHDANRQRADERRHRDLARAVEDRNAELLAHRVVAMDVLDFHRRVIDQHADRKREPAKRHDVDGLARQLEPDYRRQNRQRNRRDDYQRAPERAQEQQHHQPDQRRGNQTFLHHVEQRLAHESRLVESKRRLQTLRRDREHSRDYPFYGIDYRQRRGGGMLQDEQVGRELAVDPHQIGLHRG